MVIFKPQNIACFPWCCTLNSSSLAYISLQDESFTAHRSSMNLDVIPVTLTDANEISCLTYLNS